MTDNPRGQETVDFLKSLGFPAFQSHSAFNHFDFVRRSRRILVIGPMGSGKTEYSSRVWRDSRVVRSKSERLASATTTAGADRRNVFVVKSRLDDTRFTDYPPDALAYRGGYELCGDSIARIETSFDLEALIRDNPDHGTWIIDEASFYDERLAYVVQRESETRGLIFIFPTLILNFRKEIFNPTARLLLEVCTDVFPLTAYCEDSECLRDSFYTYRYYTVEGEECPAPYFDPLIIIGGDLRKEGPREPNYCTRCDEHHYLPGKEYAFLVLKPLGEQASRGDICALSRELDLIAHDPERSELHRDFATRYPESDDRNRNTLRVDCIAERALLYLFTELNLVSAEQLRSLATDLNLDRDYLSKRLSDKHRSDVLGV